MTNVITIHQLHKTYNTGFKALEDVNLTIHRGEIFALLGPNGAGKTTLINIVCGIVNATSGEIKASGFEIKKNFREARRLIGLVPQELTTDMFEKVIDTVKFSRNLFGKKDDDQLVEKILKDLSLWDKKDSKIMTLSGGMKRRVMIAKALSHEPDILFLDEPTAGVDVSLRKDMWQMVRKLRESGVTIILTTHYIEEAEEMADRIGVINQGKIILVEEKNELMKKLGKKQLILTLDHPLEKDLKLPLDVSPDRSQLIYTFDSTANETGINDVLKRLSEMGVSYKDILTKQSSLEDIFVGLIGRKH